MWSKYARIANDLREGIATGTYPAGSSLPPIPELIDTYGVARETVRRAIAALANEGLITPLPGIGTVVRDTSAVNLNSRPADPHPLWTTTAGEGSRMITLESGWTTADHEIAGRLSVPLGDRIIRRLRHYYKGQEVVLLQEQWVTNTVATAVLAATTYDLAGLDEQPADLYSLMRQAGLAPVETTEIVTTRMPGPDEKSVMSMPAGVPVLVTLRVTHGSGHVGLETSSFAACGDRTSQTYTVSVPL
jgi:GntR family transcriptional regulator